MKVFCLVSILFLVPAKNIMGQLYSIESFQDEYIELETYSSVGIEEEGDFYWDKRFQLDFEFPFYEFTYNYLDCDYEASCIFDNSTGIDFPITLMTFGYEFDNILDTVNLTSDVRYALITKEDVRAFVLQFTRTRLISDPSIQEFDSYINFQLCFYETGDLEVRFGDVNLDNSPCYVPGDGFYFFPENQPPINLGPAMGITNPQNDKDAIGLEGAYNDYEVEDFGYLRVLPPEGWVIRFRRNPDATKNINTKSVRIYPNPAQTEVTIDSEQIFERMDVFDTQGGYIKSVRGANQIDISDLIPGMYVVKAFSAGEMLTGRFIKL